jgi:L-lactate dehydrogenase complex protein LldF
MPLMISRVKEEEIAKNGQTRVNGFFTSSERLAKLASSTSPLSNWVIRNGASRYLMEKVVGVDRRRTLPQFSRTRLRRRLEGSKQGNGGKGKLVFFPDIYADYNDPELGYRAVMLLRSIGYEVIVPEVEWAGMPYISYGEVAKATEVASRNLKVLEPLVSAGYGIVSTEPTAVYMLREIYPKLSPGKTSTQVAEASAGFFATVQKHLASIELKPAFASTESVGFHIPCHERALNSGVPAVAFLEAAGYKVQKVETGTCCGMAGTFGMKHGALGYDLSMAVGERLFKLFEASGTKLVASESSVCAMQIGDGTGMRVLHPLYFVSPE